MLLQRSQSTIKTVGHLQPSFPRRRESRISMPQEFIGKISENTKTLPPSFPQKRGNDESIRTETCTTSFPQKREYIVD
ncbi:hypothetical protein EZZ76_10750 [Neisseria meningitidis]|nr:hypothetical protein [Neisseria meningitidis]